jgi:hypothetical protein
MGVIEDDIPDTLLAIAINAYQTYQRTGYRSDVDLAVISGQTVIRMTVDEHSDRASWFNNFGVMLGRRYQRTVRMSDVEKSVGVATQAVESMPEDHPDRPACLNNLGTTLVRQYRRTGHISDLDEAI